MFSRILHATRVSLVQGDLTRVAADAIVNAANAALAGGGGVDGAIHRAGGPSIAEACRAMPWVAPHVRCPAGEVRVTPAGNLPARIVVHAVGPIWREHSPAEAAALLASCHTAALDAAIAHGCSVIAFPAISTGAYGYPVTQAARVALGAVAAWLERHPGDLDEVVFALFGLREMAAFKAGLLDGGPTPVSRQA